MHASSPLRKQVTIFENSIIKLARIESENADVLVREKEIVGVGVVEGVGPTRNYVNID